jgi:hypothetical protein
MRKAIRDERFPLTKSRLLGVYVVGEICGTIVGDNSGSAGDLTFGKPPGLIVMTWLGRILEVSSTGISQELPLDKVASFFSWASTFFFISPHVVLAVLAGAPASLTLVAKSFPFLSSLVILEDSFSMLS